MIAVVIGTWDLEADRVTTRRTESEPEERLG